MKPTNSTAHGNHNTSCSTGGGTGSSATCSSSGSNAATAHADASKRYGNGTTAAQIANGNGAPAGTTVYGPGNSQPHKVTDCKNKHAVDVHAVKSYSSAACTQASTSGSVWNTAHTSNTSHSSTNTSPSVAVTGHVAAGTSATGAAPTTHQGGVLGATASAGKGSGDAGPQGGVLDAIQAVGGGSLPFTGFPLWIAVVTALALIALGLTLRRQARVTA